VEISLAKGKKQYDKRDSIKSKDIDRQMQRDLS
jgi:SsrA-binding protein